VKYLRQHRHTVLDCVPLPVAQTEDARIFFRKAIEESDAVWATHKRLLPTSQRGGGLRAALPEGFSCR
jgi:hypothetical protein